MIRNNREKSENTQNKSKRSIHSKLHSVKSNKKNQYHSILMEIPTRKPVGRLTAPIQPGVPPMPNRPRRGKNSLKRRAASELSPKRKKNIDY